MPLQNRVTPFGELIPEPTRGGWLGNRGGRIHDPTTRRLTGRRWASRQWICCRLDFRGRARTVWGAGYTELFFLDEVTALGAGHRPCAECRRIEARLFQAALARSLGLSAPPTLREIDARLHAERLDGRSKRKHRIGAERVPLGAMVAQGDAALAVHAVGALPWTPAGYGAPRPLPHGMLEVLTPPLVCTALRGGYAPVWHPTAPPSRRARGRALRLQFSPI